MISRSQVQTPKKTGIFILRKNVGKLKKFEAEVVQGRIKSEIGSGNRKIRGKFKENSEEQKMYKKCAHKKFSFLIFFTYDINCMYI